MSPTGEPQADNGKTDYQELDRQVSEIYRSALHPLAQRLAFDLPVRPDDPPRRPTALLLGNHSSGKSSFINHLLGTDLQKTGLAPTDDGFTIVTYGERPDSLDGQTVASHPELACRNLNVLGPSFLSRLRLRAEPVPILRDFNLIDSPGMIDTLNPTDSRQYDFFRSIQIFAEHADLILFFFDPDKPGTTAETVAAFTRVLSGLEHKLMIIMNKVDQFSNMRDFARCYGALCWNLSKAMATKDIPHIFIIYLPEHADPERRRRSDHFPLDDFDRAREEIVSEVKRAPTRRADNLVSDLIQNGRKLTVHARVCDQAVLEFHKLMFTWFGSGFVILSLTILTVALLWQRLEWQTLLVTGATGALAGAATALIGKLLLDRFSRSLRQPETLDLFFNQAYHRELTLGERLDLQASWANVRESTANAFKIKSPFRFPFRWTSRHLLSKLEQTLETDIPALRRSLSHDRSSTRETD